MSATETIPTRWLRLRWWPLVLLTSPERREVDRWALVPCVLDGKKAVVLQSPRGRQWRLRMGFKAHRGTWIAEV